MPQARVRARPLADHPRSYPARHRAVPVDDTDTWLLAAAARELEAHLVECESCQRAVRFDRRFKQLVRRCADPPEPVPTTVVESLRIRVERTILRGNSSPS